MTYSTSTKSASEQAALAADKTLFLTRNACRNLTGSPYWLAWSGVTSTNADTLYEPGWAADGQCDEPTSPALQSPAVDTYDLIFPLKTSVDGVTNEISAIVLFGHNLNALARALSATLDITVNVGNSSSFVGAPVVAEWVLTGGYHNPPLVSVNLDPGFTVYSGVAWLRVRIESTVAFSGTMPQIGEVFAGRSRQLGRRPDRPFDAKSATSNLARARTKTGAILSYERYAHVGDVKLTYTAYDGTDRDTGLDDVATLEAWYQDLRAGAEPFVFIDKPGTAPEEAQFVALDPPERRINFFDINLGEISISLIEYPPFLGPELYP